jgi:DNA-binding beta-propeller fold protein YncE
VKRNLCIGAAFLAVLALLGVAEIAFEKQADAQTKNTVMAPRFEVDPFWPKPLPNKWHIGQTIGVDVDPQDHVWIIHRADSLTESEVGAEGAKAPPVLEFDKDGNVLAAWGGPDPLKRYEWPNSNHGVTIDNKGFVWIGGNGNGDAHILKFTQSGQFVAQYGHMFPSCLQSGGCSNDMENFGRVAKIVIDAKENEAYIADGYLNHRVAVIDMDNGKIKRYWGGYGNKPDDTNMGPYNPDWWQGDKWSESAKVQQFRTPVHCAQVSNDGFVYVCDRPNDRIQVFTKDGKFVKEKIIAPRTLGDGSTWDIAFSKDPDQKYMYLADGKNELVYIMDRKNLEVLTSFGDGGRQPGQFFAVHSIVTDSKGNIYTTETYEGRRVQKFVYKGLAPATKKDQGTVWPTTSNSSN